ncbi:hypothetical protein [Gluconobacter kanchanaburiensis]|nr:hypothetical protein [Gluconobacter kanchanaburiensis]MBF0860691.1 hypothetical protein [Gluconobacter kanchanaburiensis]
MTDRERVEPIWTPIVTRAGVAAAAAATTTESNLSLQLPCGTLLAPRHMAGDRAVFSLPDGVRDVRIVSRTSRPRDMVSPFINDPRELGVLVRDITLFESAGHRPSHDGLHRLAGTDARLQPCAGHPAMPCSGSILRQQQC